MREKHWNTIDGEKYIIVVPNNDTKPHGEKISVEPLMPGNNSGQPKACIEHFVARK